LIVDGSLAGKPKPFFSQSIASNPAIVRRAVLEDWKPPIFGMVFFTRKWSLSMPAGDARRRSARDQGEATHRQPML